MDQSKASFDILPVEIKERIFEFVHDAAGSLAAELVPVLRLRPVSRSCNAVAIKTHFKLCPQLVKLIVRRNHSRSHYGQLYATIGPRSNFKEHSFFFKNVVHLVIDVGPRVAHANIIMVNWIRDTVFRCWQIGHLTIIVGSMDDRYYPFLHHHITEVVREAKKQKRSGYIVSLDFEERGS